MKDEAGRVVGADRVLAVLAELAHHADGIALDDLAARVGSPKSTVHRALAALRRAGFAAQPRHGWYRIGDEFLRLAYEHQAARPESARVEPALQQLSQHFGETAHYAVLDGSDVVYRAKVDPPAGSVRLTSVVGGRNPAHRTAVGKLLLSERLRSESDLRTWLAGRSLEPRTPSSITTVSALWAELELTRERGYATDDQENEVGINCVAIPVPPGALPARDGAISVSALAFRHPLAQLVEELPTMREIVDRALGSAQ
ncbi:IclR family transcriptional regulator [Amnibacterium sp. CER49]|uniref:IclR family transcriptional regulator n=1 Tax=Amnibacterium sp. CER49 TaxID=3039161 RepID=UPI00244B43D9|nr:IclR family transcriptional regulator [Amnibacterium sp. CER49]MDH2443342.1 IclR family transcriptional regulator [Amnibacterium sp. CER49]